MTLRDRQERLRIAVEDQWARLSPAARKRLLVGAGALPVLLIAAVVLNLLTGGPGTIEARTAGPVTFEGGENPAFAIDLERMRAMSIEAVREEVSLRRKTLDDLGRGAPDEQRSGAEAAVRRAEQVLAERGG